MDHQSLISLMAFSLVLTYLGRIGVDFVDDLVHVLVLHQGVLEVKVTTHRNEDVVGTEESRARSSHQHVFLSPQRDVGRSHPRRRRRHNDRRAITLRQVLHGDGTIRDHSESGIESTMSGSNLSHTVLPFKV